MIRPTFASLEAVILAALMSLPASAAVITFPDPADDTFGGVGHDLLSIQTNATRMQIAFTASFAGEIAPASDFDFVKSVTGFIDFDTDQNSATGGLASDGFSTSNQTAFGQGASGLGIEYYIDLGLEFLGEVPVVDAFTGRDVGLAPIVFSPMSFTVTVPTSLLGGDDGNVNYGVLVGDFFGPTDEATNPDQPVAYSLVDSGPAVIPEPASLLVWCLLALGFAFCCPRRRKSTR